MVNGRVRCEMSQRCSRYRAEQKLLSTLVTRRGVTMKGRDQAEEAF